MMTAAQAQTPLSYPVTAKDYTVDTYFDTQVDDPYRWLENDTSAATAAWVKEQNKLTRSYLDALPGRDKLRKRFTELINYPKISAPFKRHGRYYTYRNSGLQNQSVLYVQESLADEPRVLLDPNTLSVDGTVALQRINFSHDGRYMAYVISRSGSDWNEIYVIDLTTGNQLTDHIEWAKFTDAQWLGDGFFYSAYDPAGDGTDLSAENQGQKVYYHRLGTPQKADTLIYENPAFPLRFYSVEVADDESFMLLYESEGHGNNVYFRDLAKGDKEWTLIFDRLHDDFNCIGHVGDTIYFSTNSDAPMGKLVATSIKSIPSHTWSTIIPERANVLGGAQLAGDRIIAYYDRDASSHPELYDRYGHKLCDIKLPIVGDVGFSSKKGDDEVFMTLTSFTRPATIYRYDMESNTATILTQPALAFNPDDYTTEEVFYPSKDGTMIHMFLTYRKGLKRNGHNPVFLYGYGGFNISLNPAFSAFRFAFVEAGGIWAVANLRGGGEYGEEWHQAGTKLRKQNVFDDFIAAAEYLIKQRYTDAAHIAINGGSNGGLLVGAVVNQRPDLFRVAVPQVGVMDMLRYHKFTIGWNWAADYGRSDDSPEMFNYLRRYSPLHSIKNDGTPYPAILVTTADHDDRVVPAHSFKYAATLQAADTGSQPKLIRIDSKAGHGGGKPISKQIDEYTDVFSFIMYHLGMKP